MISGLNNFLLILLVLLQFIAPLVHAHSDNEIELERLQYPKMESLFVQPNQSVMQVHYHWCDNQHAIISIGVGINDKDSNSDNASSDYLIIADIISLRKMFHEINFSPQIDVFNSSPFSIQQAPRAPPLI